MPRPRLPRLKCENPNCSKLVEDRRFRFCSHKCSSSFRFYREKRGSEIKTPSPGPILTERLKSKQILHNYPKVIEIYLKKLNTIIETPIKDEKDYNMLLQEMQEGNYPNAVIWQEIEKLAL